MSNVVISNQTLGLLLEIDEGVEHRLQPRSAELHVELVGEALQVDVRRVHLRVELAPRLGADVAGGDGDRLDAELMARVGGVHRILGEDHGIVVREGDAPRSRRPRRLRDRLRRGVVHQRVHLARLRDVPVLAELAREVAAGGAERQHARAGVEMIERLFLDRIDAESRRASVGRQHDRVALALADEAGAPLAFVQAAVAGAEIALDAPVGQRVPPAAGMIAHRRKTSAASSRSFHLVTV